MGHHGIDGGHFSDTRKEKEVVQKDVVASLRKKVRHGDILALKLKKSATRFKDPEKLRVFLLTVNVSNMAGKNPNEMTGWFAESGTADISTVRLHDVEDYQIIAKYSDGDNLELAWSAIYDLRNELRDEKNKSSDLERKLKSIQNNIKELVYKFLGKEFVTSLFKADIGG